MERARSYRRERLAGPGLERARERARHVIVLMLENRSFDHLLGRLDHPDPDFPRVEVGGYPNPYESADLGSPDAGTPAATVADTGGHRLEIDPPHGHVSVMTQINRRLRSFAMNGFVASYAQKIAGKEELPFIHWRRLAVVAALAVVPLAAAAHDLARRAVEAGWSGFAPWAVAAVACVAAALWFMRLPRLPGIRLRWLAAASTGVAFALALAAEGVTRWAEQPRGALSWTVAWAVVVALALRYVQQRSNRLASVPGARVRELSERVMWCLRPEQVPALADLARRYAVCTRWHSSVPGPTWPNRNFAHAASSDESVDIELGFYRDRTIFEALEEQGERGPLGRRPSWRVYHHDTPQLIAFDRLWHDGRRAHWFDAGRLLRDIEGDALPEYAFVEPCHTGPAANSQHPGNNESLASDDFTRGDRLIATIHNALVERPRLFERTVLIVTYDEHGGLFDHVPPPKAVHPHPVGSRRRRAELSRRLVSYFVEYRNRPFPFTHLGVRVPAVVVSPWVAPGRVDPTVYDHATIPATVGRLWAPDTTPLTRRDEAANDVLHLLVDRAEPTAGRRCTAYDAVTDQRGRPLGVDDADLREDPSADGGPAVLQRDDFGTQLAALNRLVRLELDPDGDAGVPTIALFRSGSGDQRAGPPAGA